MITSIDTTPLIYFSRPQHAPRRSDTIPVGEQFRQRAAAAAEQPVQEPKPRSLRLERGMFEGPGYTRGCPGCQTLEKDDGIRRGGHTQACRARIEESLRNSDDGRTRLERAETKKNEYLEKVLGRDERQNVRSSRRHQRSRRRRSSRSRSRSPRRLLMGARQQRRRRQCRSSRRRPSWSIRGTSRMSRSRRGRDAAMRRMSHLTNTSRKRSRRRSQGPRESAEVAMHKRAWSR